VSETGENKRAQIPRIYQDMKVEQLLAPPDEGPQRDKWTKRFRELLDQKLPISQ
jgi:hypothetical protein